MRDEKEKKDSLSDFQERIGVSFNDINLLKQAFTHRSYINENKKSDLKHNERLEFLGDAVLELVVTDHLYRKFPSKPEGELTALRASLVNTVSLRKVATDLSINEELYLSRGESKDIGRARDYILANAVEAIIGAVYLDKGYEEAKNFVDRFIFSRIEEIIREKLWVDAKSFFQEKSQEIESETPIYKVLEEKGPDHDKLFTSGVYLKDELIAKGQGRSKQEAEQKAAEEALLKKDWK